jgi:GTPase
LATFAKNYLMHKSGFVNIIGNPNVGKSTLMNKLTGENLSIITSKSQTTRHRILGIVTGEGYQIVYSDTPGIIKPHYKLQESMMSFVQTALDDADIILYVTDVKETPDKNIDYLRRINLKEVPVIMVLNKIDLSTQEEVTKLIEIWKELLPRAEIIPVSALESFNVNAVFDRIVSLLPEGPAYYDAEELTDKSERFFASEIIREKIFLNYRKELPYSVEVEIEEFKESSGLIGIRALIHVTRDSQKGIIIGHQGQALKKTGTMARIDMEKFFGKKVFLELFVKVTKDWRDKPASLRRFGYDTSS